MFAFSNNAIANRKRCSVWFFNGYLWTQFGRTTPQDAARNCYGLLRNPGRHQQSAVNAFNSGDFANAVLGLDVADGCGVARCD